MFLAITIILSLAAASFEFFTSRSTEVLVSYGLIVPLLSMAPRFILGRILEGRGVSGKRWLAKAESLIFLIVLFNAPGSLFFHGMEFQYDRFLHFSMGIASTALVFVMLMVIMRAAGLRAESKGRVLFLAFVLTFVGLFAWEGLQFTVDKVFSTRLFSDTTQPIVIDFWEDIVFGFVGVLLGLWYSSRAYEKLDSELS